ncbi:universal stress protein [Actinomycetospora chlora]|uniref:Universal stress protein n=1 Tax=Actinomycetospora chlora TaxID=663608 RepID=A0ABP9B511_9PSEU
METMTQATEQATDTGDRPTVVVGVDDSAAARAALASAMRSAALRGARLLVLSVYEPPEWRLGPAFMVPLPSRAEIESSLLERARALVGDVAYELGAEGLARPEITVEARPGRAAETLVEAARGADELVVGHRGRGAVSAALLGSVGWGCVLHAPCPVRVVPDGRGEGSPSVP